MHRVVDGDVLAGRELVELGEIGDRVVNRRDPGTRGLSPAGRKIRVGDDNLGAGGGFDGGFAHTATLPVGRADPATAGRVAADGRGRLR
jgi:hypothetical protein